jgi:hypothetical protein
MNEPFRLHPGTLLEGDIQGQIIAYLRHEQARGRVVWFERSNGGGGRVAGRWIWFYRLFLLGREPVSTGKADLTGMLAGGRFFALEVKQRGKKSTADQREYLEAVASGGGIAATVRSFQDAKRELFGE